MYNAHKYNACRHSMGRERRPAPLGCRVSKVGNREAPLRRLRLLRLLRPLADIAVLHNKPREAVQYRFIFVVPCQGRLGCGALGGRSGASEIDNTMDRTVCKVTLYKWHRFYRYAYGGLKLTRNLYEVSTRVSIRQSRASCMAATHLSRLNNVPVRYAQHTAR